MEQRGAVGAIRCRLESPQRDPGLPNCHFLLGRGLTFCQCTHTPASAVPRHSQLRNETVLVTAFLCPLSIFSGAVEG